MRRRRRLTGGARGGRGHRRTVRGPRGRARLGRTRRRGGDSSARRWPAGVGPDCWHLPRPGCSRRASRRSSSSPTAVIWTGSSRRSTLLVPTGAVVRHDSRQTNPDRYRGFLRTLEDAPCIVVGNRSAVYSPVVAGMVAIWDDGDPLLGEPLAPYVNARDAALLRQELEGRRCSSRDTPAHGCGAPRGSRLAAGCEGGTPRASSRRAQHTAGDGAADGPADAVLRPSSPRAPQRPRGRCSFRSRDPASRPRSSVPSAARRRDAPTAAARSARSIGVQCPCVRLVWPGQPAPGRALRAPRPSCDSPPQGASAPPTSSGGRPGVRVIVADSAHPVERVPAKPALVGRDPRRGADRGWADTVPSSSSTALACSRRPTCASRNPVCDGGRTRPPWPRPARRSISSGSTVRRRRHLRPGTRQATRGLSWREQGAAAHAPTTRVALVQGAVPAGRERSRRLTELALPGDAYSALCPSSPTTFPLGCERS